MSAPARPADTSQTLVLDAVVDLTSPEPATLDKASPRSRRTSKVSVARPATRVTGPKEKRPVGRTVAGGVPAESPVEEPMPKTITAVLPRAAAARAAKASAAPKPLRQTKEEAAAAVAEAALPDGDTVFA
nr:hypothetical protein [Actinomycetota bacterium]